MFDTIHWLGSRDFEKSLKNLGICNYVSQCTETLGFFFKKQLLGSTFQNQKPSQQIHLVILECLSHLPASLFPMTCIGDIEEKTMPPLSEKARKSLFSLCTQPLLSMCLTVCQVIFNASYNGYKPNYHNSQRKHYFFLIRRHSFYSWFPADVLFLHLLLCFSNTEHYRVFKKES